MNRVDGAVRFTVNYTDTQNITSVLIIEHNGMEGKTEFYVSFVISRV